MAARICAHLREFSGNYISSADDGRHDGGPVVCYVTPSLAFPQRVARSSNILPAIDPEFRLNPVYAVETGTEVLFCSLAVLDSRIGHTTDVLSPFISVF